MQEKTHTDKRAASAGQASESKEQKGLDKALSDTFPASDPAQTTPQRDDPAGVPTQEEIDRAREADRSKRK